MKNVPVLTSRGVLVLPSLPPGEPSHGIHDFPQTVQLHPLPRCHGNGLKSTTPRLQTLYCADAALLWHLQEIIAESSWVCYPTWSFLLSFPTSASPSSNAAWLSFRRHNVWFLNPSPQVVLHWELPTMTSTSCSGSTSAGLIGWRRKRRIMKSSSLIVLCWVILWWRIFKKDFRDLIIFVFIYLLLTWRVVHWPLTPITPSLIHLEDSKLWPLHFSPHFLSMSCCKAPIEKLLWVTKLFYLKDAICRIY